MASSLQKLKEDFLQCAVCIDDIDDPRILSCLHRFCMKCLKDLVKDQQRDFLCPVCRLAIDVPKGGVQGLPKDFLVSEMKERIDMYQMLQQQNTSGICGFCEEKNTFVAFCGTCNYFLCIDCFRFHSKRGMKDHKGLVKIEDLQILQSINDLQEFSMQYSSPRCPSHPDQVQHVYCNTCNGIICPACAVIDHNDHLKEDVKRVAGRLSVQLANKSEQIETKNRRWWKLTEKAQEKIQLINSEIEQLKTVTEKCYQQKKESIEEKKQRDKENLDVLAEAKIRDIRDQLVKDKETVDVTAALDAETLANSKNAISKQLKEIKSKCENIRTDVIESIHMIMRRCDNTTKTATIAIAERNHWSRIKAAPDICRALDELADYLDKSFPKADDLIYMQATFEPSDNPAEVGTIQEHTFAPLIGVSLHGTSIIQVFDHLASSHEIRVVNVHRNDPATIFLDHRIRIDGSDVENSVVVSPIGYYIGEGKESVLIALGSTVVNAELKEDSLLEEYTDVDNVYKYVLDGPPNSHISAIHAQYVESNSEIKITVGFAPTSFIYCLNSKFEVIMKLDYSPHIHSIESIACWNETVVIASNCKVILVMNDETPKKLQYLASKEETENRKPVRIMWDGANWVVLWTRQLDTEDVCWSLCEYQEFAEYVSTSADGKGEAPVCIGRCNYDGIVAFNNGTYKIIPI